MKPPAQPASARDFTALQPVGVIQAILDEHATVIVQPVVLVIDGDRRIASIRDAIWEDPDLPVAGSDERLERSGGAKAATERKPPAQPASARERRTL